MASIVTIDNVDPRIIFSGVWTMHSSQTGFNNTISLTRRIGNSATVNFVGNSIAVYGLLGPHPPDAPAITSYQIDNDNPTTFAPPSPSAQVPRMLFYQSPTLPYGSHRLVMTNRVDLDWIWLDCFEVTRAGGPGQPSPPAPPPVISSPKLTPATSPTSARGGDSRATSSSDTSTPSQPSASDKNQSLPFTSSFSSTDPSPSFSPKTIPTDPPTFLASSNGGSNSKSSPTSAIVGGVLGSLLFLIIVTGIIFLFLRKRRRNWKTDRESSPPVTASTSDLLPDSPAWSPQAYSPREMSIREDRDTYTTLSPSSANATALFSASATETTFLTPVQNRHMTLPPSKVGFQRSTIPSVAEAPLPPYSAD